MKLQELFIFLLGKVITSYLVCLCVFLLFLRLFGRSTPHMSNRAKLQRFRPVKSTFAAIVFAAQVCWRICSGFPQQNSSSAPHPLLPPILFQKEARPLRHCLLVPTELPRVDLGAWHLWRWLVRTLTLVSQRNPLLIKKTISHILVQ